MPALNQSSILSIHDIEKHQYGPVWALNQTTGADKGNVTFTVPKANGNGSDTVSVPLTFIPLDLTEQVTKDQLFKSSDFRRAVALGYLVLINDTEAQKLLEIPGAAMEKARLVREQRVSAVEEQSKAMGMISPTKDGLVGEGGILPAVELIMVDAVDKDQVEIINSLRSMESEMDAKDFEYVKSQATILKYAKLGKYCENRLRMLG